jgi:hypothetical protein
MGAKFRNTAFPVIRPSGRAKLDRKVTVGEPIVRMGDVHSVSKSCLKVGFCIIYAA